MTASPKLCDCGCGAAVAIASRDLPARGYVKGQPQRFVKGHRATGPIYHVRESGCWEWARGLDGHGYGIVRREGKFQKAYRFYFEQAKGPVPVGLELDHLCRNRLCVNPDHLEPVTHAQNIQRGANAKLTMTKAREIRSAARAATRRELALRYGVSTSTIRAVLNGKSWREAT